MEHSTRDPFALWHFPATLAGGMAANAWLTAAGAAAYLCAWIPVALAGTAVLLLEQRYPARPEWRPEITDLRTDLVFMAVVQLMVPEMLTFAVAVFMLDAARATGSVLLNWWPTGAHHGAQLVLAFVLASFIRYWLHRAAHAWPPLWALHAVHHAPRKLYWFNVGRFHPLEKILQFSVETLPLMLMGIGEPVLASYFVAYATIGFLEHSNIRMRNPVLSWVFSTADVHRWHHTRDLRDAACNFGNLLVIWDVLFGTRFLPCDREVKEVGLANDGYPQSFLAQVVMPFRLAPHRRNSSTVPGESPLPAAPASQVPPHRGGRS